MPGALRPAASFTLEAAVALPLLLFAMALMILPLQMLAVQRRMQAVCEALCADGSRYAYVAEGVGKALSEEMPEEAAQETEAEPGDEEAEKQRSFQDLAASGTFGAYAAAKAKEAAADERIGTIRFLDSSFLEKDGLIRVQLDYEYTLPFVGIFGIGKIPQSVVSVRRAWIGRDGDAAQGESAAAEAEMVWVGKNPTRYHRSPACHYLSNHFETVIITGKSVKNQKGGYCTACDRCAKHAAPGQTVYITPDGGKYHTTTECSALNSYPDCVPLSSVEHLGPCSYCYR